MRDRPRVFRQETPYSCGPACLLMVLESRGVSKTEEELRILCDCNSLSGGGGTSPLATVDAARELGFVGAIKCSLVDFKDLLAELERGVFPIAFIKTRFAPAGQVEPHCVVVVEATEDKVMVNDPWRGQHQFSREEFEHEWTATHRLAILIE
jgi:predicted double-glycine peptidase